MSNGRLPAPPHDASGHTWYHPDQVLFRIVKEGLKPYAGADYESDMPAFGSSLSDDEIRAILEYIKSTWPEHEREHQRDDALRLSSSREAATSFGKCFQKLIAL
jgi:mono/diheme cytochrome c family protein